MQLIGPAFMDYVLNGRVARPAGNKHPLRAAAPHGVFRCRGEDRWLAIAVATDAEWRGLVGALGSPEWARVPALAEAPGRLRAIDAIHERLAAWAADGEDYQLARLLQQHGVAATPVLDVADLLRDPHYRARQMIERIVTADGLALEVPGVVPKLGDTPGGLFRPAPRLGEHDGEGWTQ